jgi:acylphosphatase
MTGETVRAHAIVHGRVQGVWFRQSAFAEAQRLGLSGWVRNQSDGSVEAVFEGPRADVELALDYLAVGPPHADVEQVETVWAPPKGETGFEVR